MKTNISLFLKSLFPLGLFLFMNTATLFAQDSGYTPDTEGQFYIIMPMDDLTIDEGLEKIKNLKDEKDETLSKIRVTKFEIEEMRLGFFPYIIIRRFNDPAKADSFLKLIKEIPEFDNHYPLVILQMNYRRFLKRRDFEEYKLFAETLE